MTPRTVHLRLSLALTCLLLPLSACSEDSTTAEAGTTASSASQTSTPAPSATKQADAAVSVLDEASLTTKLITVDDLEGDFSIVDNDDGLFDPTTRTNTCVDDIADISFRQDFVPASTATTTLALETATGASRLESTLESYPDVDSLSAFVDDFLELAQSCTTAQATNEAGVAYDLTVKTDDADRPMDGADREIYVQISGSRTAAGKVVNIATHYVVLTAGNNLARVTAFDEGDTLTVSEAGVTRYDRGIAQQQLRYLTDEN